MTKLDAAVKWGILSTAHINRKVIPGAHASEKVELIAVASRELQRAEEYAREKPMRIKFNVEYDGVPTEPQ